MCSLVRWFVGEPTLICTTVKVKEMWRRLKTFDGSPTATVAGTWKATSSSLLRFHAPLFSPNFFHINIPNYFIFIFIQQFNSIWS